MNDDRAISEAAVALRAAAADLIARAEELETGSTAPAGQTPTAPAPLAPPANDDEIKARLVVLDLSSNGKSRDEAAAVLAADFPDVDGAALLDHFYAP